MDVSKQAILRQSRQGAQHATAGNVAADFKTSRRPVKKTHCRPDTFIRPCARCAHLGCSVLDRSHGFVGANGRLGNGAVFRCCLRRLKSRGFGHSPLVDGLAECVELQAQVLGDFFRAPIRCQQRLCLGRDLGRQHRGAAGCTPCVECVHAAGAKGVDAPNDAALRHAEGPHDIHLAADASADELSGEHPECTAVVLAVFKYRVGAAEVRPLAVFAYDTEQVADARGTVGDER